MTEFILYIATSLDGHIARSDRSVDWLPSLKQMEKIMVMANFTVQLML
jgi:dihydrofolate reductase